MPGQRDNATFMSSSTLHRTLSICLSNSILRNSSSGTLGEKIWPLNLYIHLGVGFLLGTRQTILETKDGGRTWEPRSIASAEEEDFNYRFNSISFKGNEGWIIGKPAILLYTSDAGENWKRVPLSSQLPGDMVRNLFWIQLVVLCFGRVLNLYMIFQISYVYTQHTLRDKHALNMLQNFIYW